MHTLARPSRSALKVNQRQSRQCRQNLPSPQFTTSPSVLPSVVMPNNIAISKPSA